MATKCRREGQTIKATAFAVGEKIILTRARSPDCRGQLGEVERIIKSRNVVRVRMTSGDFCGSHYDAFPENIDHWPDWPTT